MIDLKNIDCMDLMHKTADKFYDLAIVDPPYGINITREQMGGRKTILPDKTKSWDYSSPNKEYFDELFRVSKNQIIFGGNYFALPQSRYFFIWDKGETMYGRDFAEAEYAWVREGGTKIFKLNPNQKDRIHTTQKPVVLYKWLLNNYAKVGNKILDTHGGSMSSAIACGQMCFDITLCEIDLDYFTSGCQRVLDYFRAQNLFSSQPEIKINGVNAE